MKRLKLSTPSRPYHSLALPHRRIRAYDRPPTCICASASRLPNARAISPKLATYIQSRGAKRKTKVSLLAIPQGALSVEPLPELPRPQGPQYPYVIAQARANISKFSECVVLTRVGGFYELYFEQAEEVGPLLGLKVGRKRTRGKDADVPMAGFPFFQLDRFLKVLVQDLTRHVAIAEEYPNPNKEDKEHPSFGLMWDRRVTRIITPGTLIDEKFMDPYENNYLLCVWPAGSAAIDKEGIETEDEKIASELDTRVPVGLAWLDLSTGDFFTQISSRGALSTELARIGPREVVVDEACRNTTEVQLLEQEKRLMTFHTSSITPQDIDAWEGLLEPGSKPLLNHQGFEKEEIAAGSTLLSYVKDKLQGLSMKLQPPIRRSKENNMLIDSVTMRALEIKTTMKDGIVGGIGTLLKTVRRTVTRSGTRRLGMWLTSPETSVKTINDRLNLVEHFIQSPQLLADIQHKLKLTHDSQRLVQKMSLGRGDADDLVALARTILATQDIVKRMNASLPTKDESLAVVNHLLERISALTELADKIIKSIDENGLMLQHTIEDMKAAEITELARAVDEGTMPPDLIASGETEDSVDPDKEAVVEEEEEKPKRGRKSKAKKAAATPTKPRGHRILKEADREKVEPWIMHRAASPTLEQLHKALDDVMFEKQILESRLLDESQVSEHLIALKWTPSLGHILHLKARTLPDMTNGILSTAIPVGSSKSTHSYHLPEWTKLGSRIEMARLAIRAEEQRVLYNIRKQVILNIHALRRNAAVLDEIDIASSFAVLAKEGGWVRPILNMGTAHKVIGGRHATVQKSLGDQGRSFIANDCFVGDKESIWIITGPNMAGKSTFLRQNALISILAQTGSYVPADHAEIGIIDQIFSRVGSADDLYRQQSTFMVEMMETAHILRNATERSFVIMDEVGRGTTVEDGYAIAGGVLRYLWEVCGCRVLFATHFHGLVGLAQGWEGDVEGGGGSEGRKKVGAYCTDVMEDKVSGGWSYVHKLRRGVNLKSHAIKVARIAGLPAIAVKTAEEILVKEKAKREGQLD
ncbi:DNA mismatch repair ATPase msh1 [Orbilia brochopaga]|uniref:DNA mismatch repair ATPase msh1 n=1 Tax=Orbilia brochopaga TaxID=3140254 RepID=A0AAV9VFP9_9PEZI